MPLTVHILSESTGDTAATLAKAVSVQFTDEEIYVKRHYNIRTTSKVDRALAEIGKEPGLIVFSMVNRDLARYLSEGTKRHNLIAIDLLGPLLEAFSALIGKKAEARMGAFHEINEHYFRRIEAIEYTLRHDDNRQLHTLKDAEIVLVGVSRCSKTPVSMFLAIQHGFKVANVALAKEVLPPEELSQVAKGRIVGLTIQPDRLVEIRRSRLGRLDQHKGNNYAEAGHVMEEIEMAEKFFKRNRSWPIIDVSNRSIEETATLVLDKVYGKVRPLKVPGQ